MKNQTIELANSIENSVQVSILISRDEKDQLTLSAVFTPQSAGLHLYSKDIPKNGVDGLGRPTLLEISNDSAFEINGEIIESVSAQLPLSEPMELLIYPAGPVTLSLPIHIRDTSELKEKVYVTYMACDDRGCRAPVEHKALEIKLPKQ